MLQRRVKLQLDLANYATKANLKKVTGVDRSKFAKNVDLTSLKSIVAKSDIDKLKNVPTNLSNLKSKVDKLDIDINYPIDFSKLSDVVKNDVKGTILNITNLATTTAFAAVENKVYNVSNLVKKTDYNTKINKIEKKITDHDHNIYINSRI